MSINLNPSGIIMSMAGDRFKDKSGNTKVLKIKFPSRTTESKELDEVSLGEFISFDYQRPASEKCNMVPKEGSLISRIDIFLYADSSKKLLTAIELKNYMLRLKDNIGKPISLSEGLNFIKVYIQKLFNEEENIEYSLLENLDTIGKHVLLKKDNLKNPVLSTYTQFEKTFFANKNEKQKHFSSFIRTYDISRIRNLKKVVISDEVFKGMQTAIKLSKVNKI